MKYKRYCMADDIPLCSQYNDGKCSAGTGTCSKQSIAPKMSNPVPIPEIKLLNNKTEGLMFIGMDFAENTKDMLHKIEPQICCSMTDTEYKGYEFGVKNVLSLLEGLLYSTEDNEVLVHIPGIEGQKEFDYEDLIKKRLLEN